MYNATHTLKCSKYVQQLFTGKEEHRCSSVLSQSGGKTLVHSLCKL